MKPANVQARDLDQFYPDGLTETEIDELIEQADAEAALAVPLTSALVDGSARERRCRRMARRVATVVRALPVRRPGAAGAGEAA